MTDAPANPLPAPARFCPQCGRALEANAQGRPRCPADDHEYTWYADPKVATGVVVSDGEGRILLVRRNHDPRMGLWAFPSGFVDAGEVVEEAAVREVREEACVEVRLDGLIGVYSEPGNQVIFVAYAGTITGGTPAAGDEAYEVGCFAPDTLPPLAFAHDEQIVAEWRARFASGPAGEELPLSSRQHPDTPRPVTLLQQRGIEAEVLIPLIRRLESELGVEQAHRIAGETIAEIARQQGRHVREALGRDDLEGFTHVKDTWSGAGGDMQIETLRQDGERLEFNVVSCRFVELYRQLGAPDLGFLLSCGRDFALSEGYSDELVLERTQTIMQGAAFCDFRYRRARGDDERGDDADGGS